MDSVLSGSNLQHTGVLRVAKGLICLTLLLFVHKNHIFKFAHVRFELWVIQAYISTFCLEQTHIWPWKLKVGTPSNWGIVHIRRPHSRRHHSRVLSIINQNQNNYILTHSRWFKEFEMSYIVNRAFINNMR